MSAEFPTLAEHLGRHESWQLSDKTWDCACGKRFGLKINLDHHVADEWREACTIRTAEQLAAYWPTSTVIREEPENDFDFYPQIWEMAYQCGWTRAGEKYNPDDDSPRLPALVIWHPDGATS
ncbi:MAG: hypothetical protein PGN30_10295 [Mycolicibacterium neoaurum]|uniref:hypothetical protein n=1 Tax=Mycolicibacterium neoaurum TaxID=1795 RepID=UPI002FFCC575